MSTKSDRKTTSYEEEEGEVAVVRSYDLGKKGVMAYDTYPGEKSGTEYLYEHESGKFIGLYNPTSKKLKTDVKDPAADAPPPKKTSYEEEEEEEEGEVAVVRSYDLGKKGVMDYDTYGYMFGTEYLYEHKSGKFVGLYNPASKKLKTDVKDPVAVVRYYDLDKGGELYDTYPGDKPNTEYLYEHKSGKSGKFIGLYNPTSKKLKTDVKDPAADAPPPKKTRGPMSAATKAKIAATRAINKAKKEAEMFTEAPPSTVMLELMSVLGPSTAPPPRPAHSTPVPWEMNIRTLSSGIISLPEVTYWKPGTDSIQFGSHMASFGYKRNPEDGLYYRT